LLDFAFKKDDGEMPLKKVKLEPVEQLIIPDDERHNGNNSEVQGS